mmetsp:Transcript_8342/g.24479  ORF Transcript_8342/g.24479 Transcript_8342/m.24479 type:complete len:334 (+) Transcript_8342:1978-2979(+)
MRTRCRWNWACAWYWASWDAHLDLAKIIAKAPIQQALMTPTMIHGSVAVGPAATTMATSCSVTSLASKRSGRTLSSPSAGTVAGGDGDGTLRRALNAVRWKAVQRTPVSVSTVSTPCVLQATNASSQKTHSTSSPLASRATGKSRVATASGAAAPSPQEPMSLPPLLSVTSSVGATIALRGLSSPPASASFMSSLLKRLKMARRSTAAARDVFDARASAGAVTPTRAPMARPLWDSTRTRASGCSDEAETGSSRGTVEFASADSSGAIRKTPIAMFAWSVRLAGSPASTPARSAKDKSRPALKTASNTSQEEAWRRLDGGALLAFEDCTRTAC